MSLHIGSIAPDFTQDDRRAHPLPRMGGDLGDPVLAPQGLHAGVHHRAGHGGQAQARVRQAQREGHRLSVDDLDSHRRGAETSRRPRHEASTTRSWRPRPQGRDLYEMIHPHASDTLTVRSVFVIDPNKKVRATLTYPAHTDATSTSICGSIDSLQLTDKSLRWPRPSTGSAARSRRDHQRLVAGSPGPEGEVSQGVQGAEAVPATTPQPNR